MFEFPGGSYAVTTCKTNGDPATAIPAAWAGLHAWVKDNGYTPGAHQHLEKFYGPVISDDFTLDLYYPIKT